MNKNLIPDFDEIFGLDIGHFTLAKKEIASYLLNSQLEQLVLSKFVCSAAVGILANSFFKLIHLCMNKTSRLAGLQLSNNF